ncbi:MAG TPA: ester cyclase [Flavisolibacter sp.]|nr:ester cyclase [Flavisolibacter sp.]
MEEVTLQKEALSRTQQNILDYFKTHDPKYIAEDAVYRNLSTGEVYTGREEISGMLHFMYHVAFDAKGEVVNTVITETKAVVEAYFKGRHIGEIAGVKATNKEVDIPLCVSYDLKDGLITQARIYFLGEVFMNQAGVSGGPRQKTTFLIRDIFQLKFGHFRPVKELFNEAKNKNMMPEAKFSRVLSDFTGDAYRLILENGYDSLLDYETSLSTGMADPEWQQWYKKFMEHVESSHREILKEIF